MSMSTEERHKRLIALKDDEIDYSDIPEPDEAFFKRARLVMPSDEAKERITIRLSKEVTDYFRKQGKGYQSRIDAVLRDYVSRQTTHTSDSA